MKYEKLAKVYEQLEKTSKRLHKTHILAEFLKELPAKETAQVMLLIQGKVFPEWDDRKLGMASQLIVKALASTVGIELSNVEALWKKTGDLGTVAKELFFKKKQRTLFCAELTVTKVFGNLQKLSTLEGQGTVDRKIALVSELLSLAEPLEALYIVRTILEDLRVGLGEGTLRDAILVAYFGKQLNIIYDEKENKLNVPEEKEAEREKILESLQRAIDITNDYGEVAELAQQGITALQNVLLKPGRPVNVMLYQKAENIKEGLEIVGTPCAAEFKYDGFRLLINADNGKIKLYTRRLENATKQFPDVVSFIKENVKGNSFILDAEIVGYDIKTGGYTAFQQISQRIKRKYDIEKFVKELPIEVNVFDILYYEGKNLLNASYKERRAILEKIITSVNKKIRVSEQIIVQNEKEAEQFYKKSLSAGNEGIMMKNLEGVYKPGSRVGYGVKVKPVMETLDLIIIKATWGEGKRSKWLASFTVACRDAESGELLEIGNVGTGIKEKSDECKEGDISFPQLTELLKPEIIEDKGREVIVKPKIVLEIAYEEIQSSPSTTSGFALRFPRAIRLREDRGIKDISTVEEVEKLAREQRGRGK